MEETIRDAGHADIECEDKASPRLFARCAPRFSCTRWLPSISTPPRTLPGSGFTPMRDYAAMAKRDGYGAFFQQRDQENAAAYLRDPKALGYANGRTSPEWQQVDDTQATVSRGLSWAAQFVIYPYHAHILELFKLTGLWTRIRRLEAGTRASTRPCVGPGSRVADRAMGFQRLQPLHMRACSSIGRSNHHDALVLGSRAFQA